MEDGATGAWNVPNCTFAISAQKLITRLHFISACFFYLFLDFPLSAHFLKIYHIQNLALLRLELLCDAFFRQHLKTKVCFHFYLEHLSH